jgi:hypothetical protein
MSTITLSVTIDHIKNAKPTPEQSPIALALREMGFRDVVVLENFVYTSGDRVYRLPENAIASQKAFNFLAKKKAFNFFAKKIAKNIHPYKCELEQIQ